MKSFFVAIFGALIVFAMLTYALECPKNEILSTDSSHNITCHNDVFDLRPSNETYLEPTEPFCQCTNGLVRDDDGECVTRTECWKQMCADIVCHENEYCTLVKVPVSSDNSTLTIFYNVWAGCIGY